MRLARTLLAFLAAGVSVAAAPAAPRPAGFALPFIEDDYPAALARARASHRPIFVEAWAPW